MLGLHFFNPAPLMPLVEVIRTPETDPDVHEAAFALMEACGKQPVRCNDTPGFIVNRILIPLLNDCVRVLDETGASVEDIDKAMRFGAGWPMGPFTLLDVVGADVHVHATQALYDALGEERMLPPAATRRPRARGQARPKDRPGLLHVRATDPPRAARSALRWIVTSPWRWLSSCTWQGVAYRSLTGGPRPPNGCRR